MNHRVRSVLAAVLIMVVSILLPSDFQFENTDRFVKEQSSSIQMTAQYTDGIEKKVLHDNYLRLENPREAISAQSAEQRKSTQRLPMELLLFLICSFVCIAVFGCGEDIKGIRDMRFGIDIRGGVEAVFEPSGLKKKLTAEQLEMAREVIETRLDSQNILDREVTVDEKAGDVIVRFPWKSDEKNFDPETAIQELGEMAELTFRGPDNTVYIKGSDVSRSQVAVDQQKNYVVELEFSSEGAKKFADATEKLVGQQIL